MAMEHAEVDRVRQSVRQQLGSRVQIRLDEGRNRSDIKQGVIQDAYPSVFTVLLDGEKPQQIVSFSYTDIITRGVRMRLC